MIGEPENISALDDVTEVIILDDLYGVNAISAMHSKESLREYLERIRDKYKHLQGKLKSFFEANIKSIYLDIGCELDHLRD